MASQSEHRRKQIADKRAELAERAALLKNLPENSTAWRHTLDECDELSTQIQTLVRNGAARPTGTGAKTVAVAALLGALAVLLATIASRPGLVVAALLAGVATLAWVAV